MCDWVAECEWADVSAEDICDMDPADVIRGVERHFPGGVAGFIDAVREDE